MIAWCRRFGLDHNDAADVVQDVFAAVARRIEQYRAGSFRGWLWTITRNKLNDRYRKERDQVVAAGGTDAQRRMADIPEQLPDDSDLHLSRETDSLILRGIEFVRSEFEERTWSAFRRSVVDGERTAEIAADMGISANAVRQAKSRVLRRLRAELGESPA